MRDRYPLSRPSLNTPPAESHEAKSDGSGQSLPRIESPRLLNGQGQYTADLHRTGQLFVAFVRSQHAHAEILSLAIDEALAMPGVRAVYTAQDLLRAGITPLPTVADGFTGPDGRAAASPPRHALALGRVRHVGEAMAVVVAESDAAARHAAASLRIDYRTLQAVVNAGAALQPGAPQLCEGASDNVAAQMHHGDPAATAAAFESAAHRVTLEVINQRLVPCSLEPRCLMADIDPVDGPLTLHASTQMPTALKAGLEALIPGLAGAGLRVMVGDVGGGFGMKTALYPEDVVVCFAALQLRRPVTWCADRCEEFSSALHGRDLRCQAELALDADGRVLALRVRGLANVGAYATVMGVAIPLAVGPVVATSVYDIAHIDLQFTAVLTNTAPTGAYRGAGQPEMIHLIERLIDRAARQLGMDAATLRRLNMVGTEQMPYRNAMGQVYDSGRFAAVLDQTLQHADWAGFEERRRDSLERGRLRGRGVASFVKWTGAFQLEEQVGLVVHADGVLELLSAAQEMGQGIATACTQLAAEALGLPVDCIRVVQGDTERVNGFGSGGSRSLFTGGAAVQAAAQELILKARQRAAQALEVTPADVEYRAGQLQVTGTDLAIGLFELAARETGLEFAVNATSRAGGPSWPNACHICELELDPDTGAIQLLRYVSVNDIGRVVNPALARGQIEGAIVQGLGQAWCEAVIYDDDTGQLLSGSLMDYALPRADMLCTMETVFFSGTPCQTNVLGAKGAGELGIFGATPALANAVIDALAAADVADADKLQMPMTPDRVWEAMQKAM